MHGKLFYGCATALVTPFREDRVDFKSLEALIDWQLECGVDALVVLGTTGEPSTLTAGERRAVLECAVSRCAGRAPVIAGTGSNCTREAVHRSEEAQRLGADALLVVTPYYNRASPAGLMAHYRAGADSVDLPVIMYNVPSRTGLNLAPETVAVLARHPNLCAVKEASGSLRQMTDLAAACGGGIAIYCGNDDCVPAALALGAQGVISVAANVIPGAMHDMAARWLEGEAKACLELQLRYLPLIRLLFSEVSPIPVKAALHLMGRIENALRLPLCPLDAEKTRALRDELERLDLLA